MPRQPRIKQRSDCPISMALDLLGDSWSLLIVRDLMFKGVDSFDGFLGTGEGIATNILSDRLARLEIAKIVVKRPDENDARRFRYVLTRKGIELAPVLVELVLWSARHGKTAAPRETVAAMAAKPGAFARQVIADWRTNPGRSRKQPGRRPARSSARR
jgi:DNA-binding HxlR family transcriptional regulator